MSDDLSEEEIIAVENLIRKGESHLNQGDYQSAFKFFGQALKLAEDNNDKHGISDSFTHLGHIYKAQNQYSFAEDCYQRAFNIGFEIGNYELIAANTNNLMAMFIHKDDQSKVNSMLHKSIEFFRKHNDPTRIGLLLSNYSVLLISKGSLDEARDVLLNAIDELKGTEIKSIHGLVQDNLGQVYHSLNDSESALNHYNIALKHFKTLELMEEAGNTAYNIAAECFNRRNLPEARKFIEMSLEFYSKHANPRNRVNAERFLQQINSST